MNKKGQIPPIVRELVIGVGVIEGIWLKLGFSPESLIIDVFTPILKSFNSPASIIIFLQILPIIATLITLALVYQAGEWPGIIAVALGAIGGYLLLSAPMVGIIFILIGIAMGYFAFK